MSGAIEVAGTARNEVTRLIADMLSDDSYQDNEISLGTVILANGEEIQVQLKVTRNLGDFLDDDLEVVDESERYEPVTRLGQQMQEFDDNISLESV